MVPRLGDESRQNPNLLGGIKLYFPDGSFRPSGIVPVVEH